jgi:hypothetical protein
MSAPQLVSVAAEVECVCGKVHAFTDVSDGWQHTRRCLCGQHVSIQVGDLIVQFDRDSIAKWFDRAAVSS